MYAIRYVRSNGEAVYLNMQGIPSWWNKDPRDAMTFSSVGELLGAVHHAARGENFFDGTFGHYEIVALVLDVVPVLA